jgi:hypothetical protein
VQSKHGRIHQVWDRRHAKLSSSVVVGCLLCLCCSPSSSALDPKRRKVVGTAFVGDDVPAGGSAETAGTDPSTTCAGVVTIAVAGTSPGYPAPSAETEEVPHKEILSMSAAPCS